MALVVEWTLEAEKQLDDIIEYLESKWTGREIRNFFRKLEKALEVISTKPLHQKKSERRQGTYEYQLSPQTTIFYSFDKSVATILVLWLNRMNPEDLNL